LYDRWLSCHDGIMRSPVRTGVVGLVHDHVWDTLTHIKEDGRGVIVAAQDANEPLLERVRAEYGVASTYDSVEEMLEHEDLDAIVVGSENNRHAPIVEAAAPRGVHVMVEKPMAATLAQARGMVAASEQHNIMLMVNWPTTWSRSIALAYSLVQEGRIGQPFYLKYHAGHQGPREYGTSEYFWRWLHDPEKNGPGALMDYCCYGANLSCYFLGKPQSVTGVGGRYVKDYDIPMDNAILLLQYERAVGVAEASWSQIGHPPDYQLTVMGSMGSIVAPSGEHHLTLVTETEPTGQTIEAPPLPAGRDNEAAYFLSCLIDGTPPSGSVAPRLNRDAQEILEAGARAIAEGCAVSLPLEA
jgi:predicted dehydrogenase